MKECFFDIPLFGFDPSLVCAMLAVGFNNKLFLAVRAICKGADQRAMRRDRVQIFVFVGHALIFVNTSLTFIIATRILTKATREIFQISPSCV
jgi:hypothetical protein